MMVMYLKIEILIKQIRKEKGISLSELSKLTGISKGHLSSVERGEKDIAFSKMCIIADALKVTTEDLYKKYN